MAAIHRIRLQGPWQVFPPDVENRNSSPQLSEPLTRQLPAAWTVLFGETPGIAVFQRRFNRPTNLQPQDSVSIRVPAGSGTILVCLLNGQPLLESTQHPSLFDATPHLREFNQLELQIQFDPQTGEPETGGLWQPVLLEIASD